MEVMKYFEYDLLYSKYLNSFISYIIWSPITIFVQ
jgi:hypothetical protein